MPGSAEELGPDDCIVLSTVAELDEGGRGLADAVVDEGCVTTEADAPLCGRGGASLASRSSRMVLSLATDDSEEACLEAGEFAPIAYSEDLSLLHSPCLMTAW